MITDFPPKRQFADERMDHPALDAALHRAALDGLARVNRISCAARSVWRRVVALARQLGLSRISLLDVATGGGDLPVEYCRRAARAGLDLHVMAIDRSRTALEIAQGRARDAGVAIDFREADVLKDEWPKGFDVVVCSLFLHHLRDDQAQLLLRRMTLAAGRLVVVNDLARSATGTALAWVGTRLLTRSPIVREDGPLSARAAFTPGEVAALCRQVGMTGAVIQRQFPCRFVLTWKRP